MEEESRDRWNSNTAFILAAVGSAVGLGNLWRFPYLAYKYGGGTFLFPYLVALFILGIPLLALELTIGQKLQRGAVRSFKAIHPRLGGIGMLAVFTSFVIAVYYAIVMAWAGFYLIKSFATPLPWAEAPKEYFFNSVLAISSSIDLIGDANWWLMVAMSVTWILIYLCIRKGVKSVGNVVMITVPLPILLLVILFIRGITLEGALDGVYYYIRPNFALLLSTEIWIAAASQIFFTFSIGMGVMIAYASFNHPKTNVLKDSIIIALSDAFISIFSGFVVFSIIGYMAHATGQSVADVATSGPGLAFVVFPQALALMPWWAEFFSILFFITLLTLGIDSAFSLVESIICVICDNIKIVRKEQISFWVCALCFVLGTIFTTDAGLYFLDLVDHFSTNILLVIVGLLECIAIAWIFGAEKVLLYINTLSRFQVGRIWIPIVKWVIPGILASLLALHFHQESQANYGNYPDWAIQLGWSIVLLPIIGAILMALFPGKGEKEGENIGN